MAKLKELFRRPGSRKSLDSNASPRSSLDQPVKQPTQNGGQRSRTPPARPERGPYPVSPPQRDHATSDTAPTDAPRRMSIPRRPINKDTPTIHPVTGNNQAGHSTRDSIAANYTAYLPAISVPENPSTAKHSEDIADRNIERFGSATASSRHSSVDHGDKRVSVGSLGKGPSGKNYTGRASLGSAGKTSIGRDLAEIDALLVAEDTSRSDPDGKRVSVGSLGKVSRASSTGRASFGSAGKTSRGREIGEIDVLVTADPSSPETLRTDRRDYALRVPRDEAHMSWRRRRSSTASIDDNAPRTSNYGPRNMVIKPSDGMTSRESQVDGGNDHAEYNAPTNKALPPLPPPSPAPHYNMPTEYLSRDMAEKPSLKGIVDLEDSVDVDRTTQWAPAVTHEVVKPMQHEIIEERIYREIHNYDVYHRIQPVYETEILPARHFIPDPSGKGLLEVSEDQLPGCTGANQRWFIGERDLPTSGTPSRHIGLLSPKVIDEKRYMTEEGFERIETTILHPPTLEDISKYGGPVLPIQFVHHTDKSEEEVQKMNEQLDSVPEVLPTTLKEFSDAPPEDDWPIPKQFVPPRMSSARDRKNHGATTDQKPWV